MNILLYTPDNGVTRNFMPHLWMFVLQALTPPEHKVFLIDANAQPYTGDEVARFVKENDIQLAGVGTMTRRASAAYVIADAIREAGAKVVMAGPMCRSCQMNRSDEMANPVMRMRLLLAKPTKPGHGS
jgi:hypothetical protein